MKKYALVIIFFISTYTMEAQTFLDKYFSSFGIGFDTCSSPLQFEGPFPDFHEFDTLYDFVAFNEVFFILN